MIAQISSGVEKTLRPKPLCFCHQPFKGTSRLGTGGRSHATSRAVVRVTAFQPSEETQLVIEPVHGYRHGPLQLEPVLVDKPRLRLSWAGSGMYFWWQLGAVKYLAERYDLSKVPMVGASGGALASVLGACRVDADLVFETAYQLSVSYNIWDRPLGFLGIWGALIENWLDGLLPDNAHEICRDQVSLVVTTIDRHKLVVPKIEQVALSDFTDKNDLITACMASAHVPVLLDWKLTRTCRGRVCLDGSFPDFFYNDNCEHLKCEGNAVIFDYFTDPNLVRKGRMDMLELKSHDELKRIMDLGYAYAAKLHDEGVFDMFDCSYCQLRSPYGDSNSAVLLA